MDEKIEPQQIFLPHIRLARLFDSRTMPRMQSGGRTARSYELGYFLDGDGAYCLNGIWHEVMPGDVRLCPPGTHITSRLHFRCDTIYFDIGAPETVVHHPIFADFPLYFHAGEDFEEDFAKIIHAYNADTLTAPLLQSGLLMVLLARLSERYRAKTELPPAVSQTLLYLEPHYGERVYLTMLGAQAGYSPLHLCRLFEKSTGRTPHAYLTALRLRHAREMLTETALPVYEIATACGFSSESHFKTLFRKTYRVCASAYRKNSKNL